MKEKSTTHKGQRSEVRGQGAEGSGQATEDGRRQVSDHRTAELKSVPQLTGEERYLQSVMEFARGLKRSRDLEIAKAARDWESTLDFRIRMELQRRSRRAGLSLAKERRLRKESSDPNAGRLKAETPKWEQGPQGLRRPAETEVPGRGGEGTRTRVTSSPSGVHIRLNVSPSRD